MSVDYASATWIKGLVKKNLCGFELMNSETKQTYIRRRQNRFRTVAIDGQALKFLIYAGLSWLRTNQETVNALNVYPVPDGDTGINMVLTMQAAYNEIAD